jgi:hypothetical protein
MHARKRFQATWQVRRLATSHPNYFAKHFLRQWDTSACNCHKGQQNPAIQIACQSRKTNHFQTFWPRLYWFDAANWVTAAGSVA